jgi:hypothetical protein
MFSDKGSPKAVTASVNETPCLRRLDSAFSSVPLEAIAHEHILPAKDKILHRTTPGSQSGRSVYRVH